MGRTFEAIINAEKDSRLRWENPEPFDQNGDLGPCTPSWLSGPQPISEEYQELKHNLRSLLPKINGRILMFASSTRGEGTSTVVARFGTVLASSGESVLLVDANLRRPSLHDIFDVKKPGGFTELLLGLKEVKGVVKNTGFSNLSIITCGVLLANPSFALGPKSVYSIGDRLKNEADWILLDTPPVNEFNDAMALRSAIDGAVLVVEAEKTKWEVALHAKQRLDDAKTPVLGVVLNRRRLHIPDWVYKLL